MKKIKNFFEKLFGDKSMALINILLIVVAAVIIALVVYGVWRVRQTPQAVEQPAEISEGMPEEPQEKDPGFVENRLDSGVGDGVEPTSELSGQSDEEESEEEENSDRNTRRTGTSSRGSGTSSGGSGSSGTGHSGSSGSSGNSGSNPSSDNSGSWNPNTAIGDSAATGGSDTGGSGSQGGSTGSGDGGTLLPDPGGSTDPENPAPSIPVPEAVARAAIPVRKKHRRIRIPVERRRIRIPAAHPENRAQEKQTGRMQVAERQSLVCEKIHF